LLNLLQQVIDAAAEHLSLTDRAADVAIVMLAFHHFPNYRQALQEIHRVTGDRLAKLKADPTTPWENMNSLQRQAALQKSDVEFQNSVRALAPVKTVQLNNYISTMEVASAVGNSPTRYSLRLKVK
jgi:hypothetical protein